MIDDVTGELTARGPGHVLEDLAQLGRTLSANGRARPEVELILAGGAQLRGRIIAVGVDERVGPIAVVMVGGTPRAPAVAYVRIDEVAAVTVADASVLVRAPVVEGPAPSRLELQRQAALRAEPLAGKLGRALAIQLGGDLDDDSRRAVGALLPVLFDVVAAIAGDALGRDALAAIDTIELGAGPTAELWTEAPRKLVLRAPRLLAEAFTFAGLRAALERLL